MVCGSFVIVYFFDPARSHLYLTCPFHALTGLYCPGCGTVRALHQLAHGHLLAALKFNPLAILTLPFLGYSFFAWCLKTAVNRRLWKTPFPAFGGWLVLSIVLCYWVLRNIPAFRFLAPG